MNNPAFSARALQLVAEDKIRSAIADGEFEDLPGFGRPLPVLSEPYDPLWWVRRKMQRESIGATSIARPTQ